jgi:hypothetical protein
MLYRLAIAVSALVLAAKVFILIQDILGTSNKEP